MMMMIKKHKNKIIAAVVVIAILAVAWLANGDIAVPSDTNSNAIINDITDVTDEINIMQYELPTETTESTTEESISETQVQTEMQTQVQVQVQTEELAPAIITSEIPSTTAIATATTATATEIPTPTVVVVPTTTPPPTAPVTEPPTLPPTTIPTAAVTTVIVPVPFTVTLTVRCDALLNNMHRLDREKHELVPDDGMIFSSATVDFSEGESVFDILLREMRNARIHFEFVRTPVFNSVYIEGINNLYEFDAGELSGWIYRVNGEVPGFGISQYALKSGDAVEIIYTLDLGRDVSGDVIGGG